MWTTDFISPPFLKSAGPVGNFSFFSNCVDHTEGSKVISLVLSLGMKALVACELSDSEVDAAKAASLANGKKEVVLPHRGSLAVVAMVLNNVLCLSKSVRDLVLKNETTVGELCYELCIPLESKKFGVEEVIDKACIQVRVDEMQSQRVSKTITAMQPGVDVHVKKLLKKLDVLEKFDALPKLERDEYIKPLIADCAQTAEKVLGDPQFVFERSPAWVLKAHLSVLKLLFADVNETNVRTTETRALEAIAKSQPGGTYGVINWVRMVVSDSGGGVSVQRKVTNKGSDGESLIEHSNDEASLNEVMEDAVDKSTKPATPEPQTATPLTLADLNPPKHHGNQVLDIFKPDVMKHMIWPHLAAVLFGQAKTVDALNKSLVAYKDEFENSVRESHTFNRRNPLDAIAANGSYEMLEVVLNFGEVMDIIVQRKHSYASFNTMTSIAVCFIDAVKPAPEELVGVINALNAILSSSYKVKLMDGHVPRTCFVNIGELLKRYIQDSNIPYALALVEMCQPYISGGAFSPNSFENMPAFYFHSLHTVDSFFHSKGSLMDNRLHYDGLMRWLCNDAMRSYMWCDHTKRHVIFFIENGPLDVLEQGLTSIMRGDMLYLLEDVWSELCWVGRLHCLRIAIEYRKHAAGCAPNLSKCLQWMLAETRLHDDQVKHGLRWAMGAPSPSDSELDSKKFYSAPYKVLQDKPMENMNMKNIEAMLDHRSVCKADILYCIKSHERGMPLSVVESFFAISGPLVGKGKISKADYINLSIRIDGVRERHDRAARSARATLRRSVYVVDEQTDSPRRQKRRMVGPDAPGDTSGCAGQTQYSECDSDDDLMGMID